MKKNVYTILAIANLMMDRFLDNITIVSLRRDHADPSKHNFTICCTTLEFDFISDPKRVCFSRLANDSNAPATLPLCNTKQIRCCIISLTRKFNTRQQQMEESKEWDYKNKTIMFLHCANKQRREVKMYQLSDHQTNLRSNKPCNAY